jgi:hypothetical protein
VFEEKPVLRVIEGGASPDVRQPLEEGSKQLKNVGYVLVWLAPRDGFEIT